MIIESCENENIKYFKKIRNIKYIKEHKEFIVEGEHLVEEAIKSGYAKELIILNGKKYNASLPKTFVSEKVLKYISTLDTPQYVMAVCKVKNKKTNFGNRIVILDGVRDPGNLGTIIRTSVAFGIDTIVLSENSVNQYNDKVVRSSQGMLFKINIIESNLIGIIKAIKDNGIKIYGTDVKSSSCLSNINPPQKYALILGNEGDGVRKEILSLCDEKVFIEMVNNCESLNVGVSAGIILYEWRKL